MKDISWKLSKHFQVYRAHRSIITRIYEFNTRLGIVSISKKKTYEQVIELKDVMIARQQSEKQSNVSKYTRWQQLKVGLPSIKRQNIKLQK